MINADDKQVSPKSDVRRAKHQRVGNNFGSLACEVALAGLISRRVEIKIYTIIYSDGPDGPYA